MKRILLLLVLSMCFLSFAEAKAPQDQPSKEYVETLKKMITVSGGDATFKLVIPQMFAMMKQQLPNVPEEFWKTAEEEIMKNIVDDVVGMLAPIYWKHLTKADLEGIIKFYETPVGKKMAAAQPTIMTESMKVGQQWGMQIAMKIQGMLKEKGYM